VNIEEFIYATETKTDLPSITFKNFHVWLAIRKHIYPKLTKGIYGLEPPQGIRLIALFLNSFYGFKYWFKRADFWFISSTTTRKFINGKFVDTFTDHIAQKLPNSWKIEYTLSQHRSKTQIPFKRVSSMLMLLIFERFFSITLSNRKKIKSIELQILSQFHSISPKDVNIKRSVKKLLGQYYAMRFLLCFKHKPKVVFMVAAYSYYGYVKALKEKGVTIIELQHGVINRAHMGYVTYTKFPNYYFPDYLLSFGTNEAEICALPNTFSTNTKVISVGSYIIDYYKYNFKSNAQLKSIIEKYNLSFAVSLQD